MDRPVPSSAPADSQRPPAGRLEELPPRQLLVGSLAWTFATLRTSHARTGATAKLGLAAACAESRTRCRGPRPPQGFLAHPGAAAGLGPRSGTSAAAEPGL